MADKRCAQLVAPWMQERAFAVPCADQQHTFPKVFGPARGHGDHQALAACASAMDAGQGGCRGRSNFLGHYEIYNEKSKRFAYKGPMIFSAFVPGALPSRRPALRRECRRTVDA